MSTSENRWKQHSANLQQTLNQCLLNKQGRSACVEKCDLVTASSRLSRVCDAFSCTARRFLAIFFLNYAVYMAEMARASTFAAQPARSLQGTARPGPSMLNHNSFSGLDCIISYPNWKMKVATLKFSVHCPYDNKTM